MPQNDFRIKREKASEIAFRSQKLMAGAEGLEPSARGFGATEQTFENAVLPSV